MPANVVSLSTHLSGTRGSCAILRGTLLNSWLCKQCFPLLPHYLRQIMPQFIYKSHPCTGFPTDARFACMVAALPEIDHSWKLLLHKAQR